MKGLDIKSNMWDVFSATPCLTLLLYVGKTH